MDLTLAGRKNFVANKKEIAHRTFGEMASGVTISLDVLNSVIGY